MLGGYPYFRVDAVNNNPSLSAAEKLKAIDEMLGANQATRALMMPAQVSSPEMQAVQRRLGWLTATLNVCAAMANGMVPFLRDETKARLQGLHPLIADPEKPGLTAGRA